MNLDEVLFLHPNLLYFVQQVFLLMTFCYLVYCSTIDILTEFYGH